MKLVLLCFLFSLSTSLFSQSEIEIKNPTLKLPPPGSTTTALFAEITNRAADDFELLNVSGDFAKTFELHSMDMSNGHMSMRKVEKIPLKKQATISLAPGGLHVMVFNLKKDLKENEQVEVNFFFTRNILIKVKAIVKKD